MQNGAVEKKGITAEGAGGAENNYSFLDQRLTTSELTLQACDCGEKAISSSLPLS
jgi:hypothetical protein